LKHREAIAIKGRKGGGIKKFIGPIATAITAVVPGLQPLTPYMAAASTAYGGYQGYREGGAPGAILGGLQGYGGAMLGAGVGSGLTSGLSSMSAGEGFLAGAKTGFSEGIKSAGISNILATPSEGAGLSLTPSQASGGFGAGIDTSGFASGIGTGQSMLPSFSGGVDLASAGSSLSDLASLSGGAAETAALGYSGLSKPATSGIWTTLTKPFSKNTGGLSLASTALRLASAAPEMTYPTTEGLGYYSETARTLMGGGAITEAGRAAQEQLAQQVSGEGFTEADQNLYESSVKRIDLNTQQRLDQLRDYYARYNALDSGQYRDQVRRTMEEADLQKSRLLGELQVAAVNRQMQAISAATGYEAQTINAIFQAAEHINYGEELRAMIKNNDMQGLRRAMNTIALAMEGGGRIDNPDEYDPNLIEILSRGGA